ncbi:putative ATP-dependent endonuclease of OLD family [Herbaspirillum sp. 1173]|uniref:ATP-dependent nuclease n=1 Tax=Herbaspirillum sp. 1173 TaxID=2817734 RepID=UPI00285EE29D|nr:AAA family ATPase [Herbaspirillum sp. 1173]MDR6743237.1 putative ATP-dependent endonuclease of OLD family [Herbaspirillum sp. 1173]
MYLAELTIRNFRKLREVTLKFQPGLNVLVGANNVGKSAVVDALRALLAGHDEPYPRLAIEDRHSPKGGKPEGDISFHYVFRDLKLDDEADFLAALKPGADGKLEAHIHVEYVEPDNTGRFKVKRWSGDHNDVPLTSDMMENLRGVYLQPLRDASQSLRPSRNSQLSRLLHRLTDKDGRQRIDDKLAQLDDELKKLPSIADTQSTIDVRHDAMLGNQFKQILEIGFAGNDFQKLSSRLSLEVDKFEIEQNGLGFNNLIFMAVVLSELSKNPDAAYRGLIVEEPEAHLHPQLQAVLLKYLASLHAAGEEKPVQLFVTSHSPNFASTANLDALTCLFEDEGHVQAFFPREAKFEDTKKEKLERYLDVTKAELFFAKRVIFVEGAAELMLVDALAKHMERDLRDHGVSLISVEGLNFDCFLPLFGKNALKIPVAVLTDADPAAAEDEEDGPKVPVYPALVDKVALSANAQALKKLEDEYIKVFCGMKTLEYDLALHADNRTAMLEALKEMHPKIAEALGKDVDGAGEEEKARTLFSGMFERPAGRTNVQKGRFGQTLAYLIRKNNKCTVPAYIEQAIKHVCPDAGPDPKPAPEVAPAADAAAADAEEK